jgi:two-component system sensor histidine kinase UhpB
LYRIAQEALQNVSKHAHARQARVLLRRIGDTAELTISDDGEGPDPHPSAPVERQWLS